MADVVNLATRLALPPELAAKLEKRAPARQRRPRRTDLFLQIPHRALVAGSKVLGGKQLLVWLYIHHRVWADKVNTVVVGNKTLGAWGVGRREKYKALHQLEGAGLVSVQGRERRSPLVTLIYK